MYDLIDLSQIIKNLGDRPRMNVELLLKKECPNIDEEVFHYVCGVLESPDDFQSAEDVHDAVGGVLFESLQSTNEDAVLALCSRLYSILIGEDGESGDKETADEGKKLLDAPVQLATKLKDHDDEVSAMNTIWMAQDIGRTSVDQKKLEKVDAKLKVKLEKKAQKEQLSSEAAAEKGITLSGPTTNQAVSRQVEGNGGGGQVIDIKIENFDIAFGNHVLLSNANLTLARGRRYGLVGRNGAGKTTLLRSLATKELRLPSGLSVLHVEQEVTGDETLALDSVLQCDTEREQLLSREKELLAAADHDQASSATGELAEVYARLNEIDADQAPSRAGSILAGLGFTPEMQSTQTKEFSGGWRMRLALARTLFGRPDVLLLDEPTNMLDLKAIMWLEDFLQTWPSTLLTVSHDRVFLTEVCTDIIHLHSKTLNYYKGDYEVFEATKTERLKNQQREYESQMQYRQHLQEFIDRWRYNAKRASQAQMRIKILEKLPVLTPVVMDGEVILRFLDIDKLSPPILQLTEVKFGYSPNHLVFEQLSINADMESRIALVGENGAGKSTLVKLLTGELSPQDGYRNAHRNLKIAYFSQHHVDQLVMEVTPLQFIQSKFPGKKDEEYRSFLGQWGVTGELALRPIASLSGGQKSRLAFALMAIPRPNFLIMDEPTNHLDVETVDALAKALAKFKGGVVLVSHDQHLIEACATEVWLCKDCNVKRLEGGLKEYRTSIQSEFRSQ